MLKQGGIIFGSAVGLALLVVGLMWLILPHEYSSTTRVLVVQKYTLTDSYTATKSAEKIGDGLSAVIHTSSFIDRVAQTGEIDLSRLLAMDEKDKREEWEKMVGAQMVTSTSMLEITAYDEDTARAEQLVNAVADVLVNEGAAYHGAGDTVELRVVDSALTSTFPARPNIMVYGPAAFLLGAIIGLLIVFFHPNFQFEGRQVVAPSAATTALKPRQAKKKKPNQRVTQAKPLQEAQVPKPQQEQEVPIQQHQPQGHAVQQPEAYVPAATQQPQQQAAQEATAQEHSVLSVENFGNAQFDSDDSTGESDGPQTMHDHTKNS